MSENYNVDSGIDDQEDLNVQGESENVTDSDIFSPQVGEGFSAFDALKAELKQAVKKEPIVLPIPGRPGLAIRFDIDIDQPLFEAWQRRVTRKRGNVDRTDVLQLTVTVIASKALVLLVNGQDAIHPEEGPINFRTHALRDMLGLERNASQREVCAALYGFDAHIILAGQEVLKAAGYDDSVDWEDDEDPTQPR